jgi:hypothetical protein
LITSHMHPESLMAVHGQLGIGYSSPKLTNHHREHIPVKANTLTSCGRKFWWSSINSISWEAWHKRQSSPLSNKPIKNNIMY